MVYYGPYYYGYGRRRREPSIFDGLTLSPLPYPVLLILILISLFLGIKFYSSYEEAAESAEVHFNWLLLATPLTLIFAVKWLSSFQHPGYFCGGGGGHHHHQKWPQCGGPGRSSEGGSPWGVAALILLLLVLVQYHF